MSTLAAITVDYETWQPIPPGKRIDWARDVFEPAGRLMATVESANVVLTFMAEMGEYFWLEANQPQVAERMRAQWREALRRGHDVQLHLHPSWLPELGAQCQDGRWSWDFSKAKADDYPGNLTDLIGRCKTTLESTLTAVDESYQVVAFRAGSYQVQPFRRLFEALVANEILADSSVYAGGRSDERGYDFRFAYSAHQPYFANPFDPQLKAAPGESEIVELPVFTHTPSQRWSLDNDEGPRVARRLGDYLKGRDRGDGRESDLRAKLQHRLARAYQQLAPWRRTVNRLLPRSIAYGTTAYRPERSTAGEYFVMIGHTKANLDHRSIGENIRCLRDAHGIRFVTLSSMARTARGELREITRSSESAEAEYQVKREFRAVMGEERNTVQSHRLQEMVPMDRARVLDLGCGAGYWSDRLAKVFPWMQIVGLDYGFEFIRKANRKHSVSGARFTVGDFSSLPFAADSFDCIYADNTLEHAFDPLQALREAYRILSEGGVLVTAIPSDGRNPGVVCENHTWKTVPHDVQMRLAEVGFVNVELNEIDTYRKLGAAPFPPSRDRMMYIRAWKRSQPMTAMDRAWEVTQWVYRTIQPGAIPLDCEEPRKIVALGRGLCMASTIVLGSVLQAEGFDVRWLTMLAQNHPRGSGPAGIDSHEVLLVRADGCEVIFDPMAGTCIPHSLDAVLADPRLAVDKENPDERYISRGYELYDTARWYSRVFKYRTRSDYRQDGRFGWKKVRKPRQAA